MQTVQRWFWVAIWLGAAALAHSAAKTQARLVVSHEVIRPGETITAGVHLRMAPGWHTYWRNAGDAGAATTVVWTLPEGVGAGEIQWPIPLAHLTGDLVTYGYEDEVVLLVPLSVGATRAPGPVSLGAQLSWLECDAALCVPGKAEVRTELIIGSEARPSADAALIAKWRERLPLRDTNVVVSASWAAAGEGDTRGLNLEWSAPSGATEGSFYPYEAKGSLMKPTAAFAAVVEGKVRQARVVEKIEGDWPDRWQGIVMHKAPGGMRAHEVTAVIAAAAPPAATAESVSQAAAAESSSSAPPARSLLFYLGLAFLGGLILNIMPCVLPVIALKILGFVNQSREAPGRVRVLGLVYAGGVLCSFLVLAGLVIGVMQAGHRASWGMQFGNPQFIVVLTVLVTLVALNLFGLFEVTLAGGAMDAAGHLAAKEGMPGAFFNGVLATALATPCSAPFLGAALGFAFTQPPGVIVMVFLTVGLGLALPYVLLCWQPGWLRLLPKPGAWMERFKIAMGFPMLATAVWLMQLAANHYGKRTLWLGLFLVVLALAAWMYGEFFQRGSRRRGLAATAVVGLLAGGYLYAVESQLRWREPQTESAGGPLRESPDGIAWEKWSPEAVAKARAAGRPVFVDFTADWCVTCQVNKKTSIEIPATRAKLKEINAVALLADYTNTPDDITEELARHGRAAVPLVLVYPREASRPPIVLPEALTPGIVLRALEEAAK